MAWRWSDRGLAESTSHWRRASTGKVEIPWEKWERFKRKCKEVCRREINEWRSATCHALKKTWDMKRDGVKWEPHWIIWKINFLNVMFSGKNTVNAQTEGDQQLKWDLKAVCHQMVTSNIRQLWGSTYRFWGGKTVRPEFYTQLSFMWEDAKNYQKCKDAENTATNMHFL